MSAYKLRIKIGQHEFEAEGDADVVKQQFEGFKTLIGSQPHAPQEDPKPIAPPSESPQGNKPLSIPELLDTVRLERVVRADGKKPITLRALPRGEGREGDAALILLLAYKVLWQQDEMAAARILDGLQISGYKVERVDRLMDRFIEGSEPLVMRTGVRRGVRYRLTTRGAAKAKELAEELARSIA